MSPTIVADLLGNFGIVFVIAGFWSLALDWGLHRRLPPTLITSLFAAACTVLLMSFPIEVFPRVIFDLRAVPIVLSGLLGGPAIGLAVGVVAAAYRLAIGGVGALPAIAGMSLLAVIGIVGGHLLKGRSPTTSTLIMAGVAAAVTNMLGPLLLPADLRWRVLEQVALPAMSLVLVAVVFVGKMIANELERREVLEELRVAQRQLSEANRSLSELARVDGLTGIANRRAFDEALTAEIGRTQRSAVSLGLIMIDVDNFKAFNDRYGHLAGDDCLRAIVAAALATLRSGDFLARFGGEELAILLPMTDADGAAAVAEKVHSAISGLRLPHEGSSTGFVTVSVGVATMVGPRGVDPHTLTKQADEALYEAKRAGRNRVVVRRETYNATPGPDLH